MAPLPTGADIGTSELLLQFQSALEFFLPAELGWRHEAFDAFRFAVARKLAPGEVEFVGLALLISEQAWTPIHLRIHLSAEADEVAGLDCRVGEIDSGTSGLVRIPYGSSAVDTHLFRLPARIESIHWVHRATRYH